MLSAMECKSAVRSIEAVESTMETIVSASGAAISWRWDGARHLQLAADCSEGELYIDSLAPDLLTATVAELRRVGEFYAALAGSLEFADSIPGDDDERLEFEPESLPDDDNLQAWVLRMPGHYCQLDLMLAETGMGEFPNNVKMFADTRSEWNWFTADCRGHAPSYREQVRQHAERMIAGWQAVIELAKGGAQ